MIRGCATRWRQDGGRPAGGHVAALRRAGGVAGGGGARGELGNRLTGEMVAEDAGAAAGHGSSSRRCPTAGMRRSSTSQRRWRRVDDVHREGLRRMSDILSHPGGGGARARAVRRTPLLAAAALDRVAGRRVLVKAECLQVTGLVQGARRPGRRSRRWRAAALARGVFAYSSGNHAQGVAWAAAAHGAPAVILMPLGRAGGEDRGDEGAGRRGGAVRSGAPGP